MGEGLGDCCQVLVLSLTNCATGDQTSHPHGFRLPSSKVKEFCERLSFLSVWPLCIFIVLVFRLSVGDIEEKFSKMSCLSNTFVHWKYKYIHIHKHATGHVLFVYHICEAGSWSCFLFLVCQVALIVQILVHRLSDVFGFSL